MLVINTNRESEVLKLTIGDEVIYIFLHPASGKNTVRFVVSASENVKITREKKDDSLLCRK